MKISWLLILFMLPTPLTFAANLDEQQRKIIYSDFYTKFVTVAPESARKYPTDSQAVRGWSGEQIMEQAKRAYEYQNYLFQKYENEILNKYGISVGQLSAIRSEGNEKEWKYENPK